MAIPGEPILNVGEADDLGTVMTDNILVIEVGELRGIERFQTLCMRSRANWRRVSGLIR